MYAVHAADILPALYIPPRLEEFYQVSLSLLITLGTCIKQCVGHRCIRLFGKVNSESAEPVSISIPEKVMWDCKAWFDTTSSRSITCARIRMNRCKVYLSIILPMICSTLSKVQSLPSRLLASHQVSSCVAPCNTATLHIMTGLERLH